jgi:hypothetical protein
VAGLAGLIVMVSLVVTVGVAGSSDPTSATMTLFARDDPAVSQGELSADAKIIRDRLHALGDASVRVSVSDDTIVVAGGTVELVDPSGELAESPALLVRPLLFQYGPFRGSTPAPPQTSALGCAETPSAPEPESPDPSDTGRHAGNSVPPLMLHPADVPLPVARGDGERDLVGPTQLSLSTSEASARVVQGTSGPWLVDISLSPHEAALLDEVASTYRPGELAVDLDGEIAGILVRDLAQRGYEPCEDRLELAEPSLARADEIAAALQAGPLPIPLELAHAA